MSGNVKSQEKKKGGKFPPLICLFVAVVEIGKLRRKEFFDGEAHLIEKVARVVFGRAAAFFFGNTEVVRRNDYLNMTHDSDYREYSECGVKTL